MTLSLMKSTQTAALAIIAATAVLLLSAMPVRASTKDDTNRITVHFSDVDAASAKGAKVLYRRLRNASEMVCHDDDTFANLWDMRGVRECEQQAMESAVALSLIHI